MNRSLIETVMGAVVLVVAALFVMFVYDQRTISSGDGYDVYASFDNISGVGAGSDVRIGGIKVGTITSLTLDPQTYRAQVNMRLKSDVKLPDDSTAAIVSEGLLGGKFVQLVPGADDAMLAQGSEIRYTQSSVNLEEMIGKFMFSGGGVDEGGHADAPASSSFLE
jgi:phospholipid/cholesterol/gamma-HCH transport system substrate-binding protein